MTGEPANLLVPSRISEADPHGHSQSSSRSPCRILEVQGDQPIRSIWFARACGPCSDDNQRFSGTQSGCWPEWPCWRRGTGGRGAQGGDLRVAHPRPPRIHSPSYLLHYLDHLLVRGKTASPPLPLPLPRFTTPTALAATIAAALCSSIPAVRQHALRGDAPPAPLDRPGPGLLWH